MSTIHIAEPSGPQTIYSEEEARARWEQGAISPQALYWNEGMPQWRPVAEFFGPVAPGGGPLAARRSFVKDPARLTRLLTRLLWNSLGVAALAAVVTLTSLAKGSVPSGTNDPLTGMDLLKVVVGLVKFALIIATGIAFLHWIHLANRNVRGFGARHLEFTPGWAVGWYFVPILSLWKPYQAMKELWRASCNPLSWQSEGTPPLLSYWWGLWIISNIVSQASFRLSLRGDANDAMAANVFSVASDLLHIPLCLVAIRLVHSLYWMQRQWAEQPEAEPVAPI